MTSKHMNKKSISEIAEQIESLGKSLPEPAKSSGKKQTPREDYVEAINQIFALFRLNYHNQYYSAYPDAEQVNQVKKLCWVRKPGPRGQAPDISSPSCDPARSAAQSR